MYRGGGGIIGSNAMCGGGGGYYTVGNNAMYNSRGYGIGDSGLEKIIQNYSIKACFSSIFQCILPFRRP